MTRNEYNKAFNDGLYHATDFLQCVAKDLDEFESNGNGEDADLLYSLADVLLEDIKELSPDD